MIHRSGWQLLSLVSVLIFAACGSEVPTAEPTAVQTSSARPTSTATPPQTSDNSTVPPIAVPMPEPTASASPTPTAAAAPVAGFQLPNIADTVDEVRPAVVGIVAVFVSRDFLGNLVSNFSSGTGIIFAPKGLVLTNSHVIRGASVVTVTMDDGTQLEAEIVGFDRLSDLGVLRLPEDTYSFLPIENGSETLRVGDWVIAIGNALALPGDLTVTVGVVSALKRTLHVSEDVALYGLIQTDAVINPGNSGGPLLNLQGELVGINTTVLRQSTGCRAAIQGIGFAINTETATLVSDQLVDSSRLRWAWMGVFLGDLIPEAAAEAGIPIRQGVVIRGVVNNGPSDEAGILRGDIILSVDGNQTNTVGDLSRLLRQEFSVNQEIKAELFRDGSTLTLPLVLGERPR